MDERLTVLENQVSALQEQLALFGTIDPSLASQLLGFWIVTFITAHGAGRVVRWLGKI